MNARRAASDAAQLSPRFVARRCRSVEGWIRARSPPAAFLITSPVNFAAIILAGSALGALGSAPPALAIVPAGLAAAAVAGVVALARIFPTPGRIHAGG